MNLFFLTEWVQMAPTLFSKFIPKFSPWRWSLNCLNMLPRSEASKRTYTEWFHEASVRFLS